MYKMLCITFFLLISCNAMESGPCLNCMSRAMTIRLSDQSTLEPINNAIIHFENDQGDVYEAEIPTSVSSGEFIYEIWGPPAIYSITIEHPEYMLAEIDNLLD